jgi:G3E family GTPase
VEAADLVLLNKCDLFDETQLAETEQAVRNIKASAHLVRCVEGDVDFPIFVRSGSHAQLHGEYATCRDPRYSAFSTIFPCPIDPVALEQFILKNEEAIYRVKGYFESMEGPAYFDYSKTGFSITAASPKQDFGLAWITHGDAEEHLNADQICATLAGNN